MQIIQQLAAKIVGQVFAGQNLNQLLNDALRQHNAWSPQQRGALQDLCYGTLRFYGQLSEVLNALLAKPLKDAPLRDLLLVALYQLQYSKAASHAVVNHAVMAAKSINPAAGGLVNGVLRNFLRNQSDLINQAATTESGRYSYPAWWIAAVKKHYPAQALAILEAGNQHPPMTLRVNQRRAKLANYLNTLNLLNIQAEKVGEHALRLAQALAVEKLPGFFDGDVSVQDAGAQYAAPFLAATDGMRVLDACAAPGGKTAHLLELANLDLLALDKDELRLARVAENLQRLKLNARLVCGDAATPEDWWDGQLFERILADVPCSASGVVRRHPDIKWLRRPSDIERFAQQQSQILQALWPLLAAGGRLLYATCSIFPRENQQVVNEFLANHADAEQLSLPDLASGQLLPNAQHDGFFYALLQKSA
jgi:16S rRNA (cytosine967-C5)-methyltransferase